MKMKISNTIQTIWLFLAFISIWLINRILPNCGTLMDSGRWHYEATLASLGKIPYREITWQYGPLSIYLAGIWGKLFGSSINSWHAFAGIISLAIGWATYTIYFDFFGSKNSARIATLFFVLGTNWAETFRLFSESVYSPAILTGLFGITLQMFACLNYFETRKIIFLLIYSIGFSIATLSKQELALGNTVTAILFCILTFANSDFKSQGRKIILFWLISVFLVGLGYSFVVHQSGFNLLKDGLSGYGLIRSDKHDFSKVFFDVIKTPTWLWIAFWLTFFTFKLNSRQIPDIKRHSLFFKKITSLSFLAFTATTLVTGWFFQWRGFIYFFGYYCAVLYFTFFLKEWLLTSKPDSSTNKCKFLFISSTMVFLNQPRILYQGLSSFSLIHLNLIYIPLLGWNFLRVLGESKLKIKEINKIFDTVILIFIAILILVTIKITKPGTAHRVFTNVGTVYSIPEFESALKELRSYTENNIKKNEMVFSWNFGGSTNYIMDRLGPTSLTQPFKVLPEYWKKAVELEFNNAHPKYFINFVWPQEPLEKSLQHLAIVLPALSKELKSQYQPIAKLGEHGVYFLVYKRNPWKK